MRKKLILLVVALAATVAATTVSQAAADTCPAGYHLVVCPTHSFCCPPFAKCVCLF